MKSFIDDDQLCITYDNFVDLQESPAVFIPLSSKVAQTIVRDGFLALPIEDLRGLYFSMWLKRLTPERCTGLGPEKKQDAL